MKAIAQMKTDAREKSRSRMKILTLLAAMATLCAGCTSELASFDDTYSPPSVDENFPITVVERPVKLQLEAKGAGLQPSDAGRIAGFAREASAHATTPVTIAYPARNPSAKRMAGQAAGLLERGGVRRPSILVTPYDGSGTSVTLAFARKVAETRPCGNWTENMAGNQFNESGPNFGCAFQQDFAAMVANPGDLQQPRAATPPSSAAQAPALADYYSGKWLAPTTDASLSGGL